MRAGAPASFKILTTADSTSFAGAAFKGVAAGARTVTIPGEPASFTAQETAAIAASAGLQAVPAEDAESAIADIKTQATDSARILICGSLYLAGRVLSENG